MKCASVQTERGERKFNAFVFCFFFYDFYVVHNDDLWLDDDGADSNFFFFFLQELRKRGQVQVI